MTLAEKYRAFREKLGLTQQQLADELGLHRTTIVNREKGHTPLTQEMFLALNALMWAKTEKAQ